MHNALETSFIAQTAERPPFGDIPAQRFFIKWCEINDASINVEFTSREDWEQKKEKGILRKNSQGKQVFSLPTDLHLWEMMDLIKTIDHDTLARNPEKRPERAHQIQELGVIFEKAGIYLSEYLPILDEDNGRTIAKDIAREFYQYGLSLQQKEQRKDEIPEGSSLSNEDKTKLDEWFLGSNGYQKRLQRLKVNPSNQEIESRRKKLLQVYFQALARKGYKKEGEKPWETKDDWMQHLQDRTRQRITLAMGKPKREMETAMFRRGMEKLVTGMKTPNWRESIETFAEEGWDINVATEKVKLINSLELPRLKKELNQMRETQENVAKISAKELEIARKIQKAVSSFPYKPREDAKGSPEHPSKILEAQFINCVGASILGGALLNEVGIKYLHADLPKHSATVLITSDGKVYWQDFTPPKSPLNYVEITSDSLEGNINPVDLEHIGDSGFSFKFKDIKSRINLFPPEIGLQYHILNNTGNTLNGLGRHEEAIKAYQQAISINSTFARPYNELGNTLSDLGRYEEAIEAYQQAISIDPTFAHPYNGLGNALSNLGRHEEAIESYQQAISIDSKSAFPYYGLGNTLSSLGKDQEAIKAYQRGISADPKSAVLYYGLGNALSDLGKYEEAVKAYQQAISIDSKSVPPYNGLGNALNDLGKYEEAIEAYQQAISIDSRFPNPYNGLGNALSDLGRYEEAIEAYQQAISIDSRFPNPYSGLATALSSLGKDQEAEAAYEKFLGLWGKRN